MAQTKARSEARTVANTRKANTRTAVPPTPLSATRYAALLRDVQRLAHRADTALAAQKVSVFWELGARIQRERVASNSGYHNSVLRNLSNDANFSVRNLQYAVTFHTQYRRCPKDSLSWAHYRILLDRPTPELHTHYRTLALTESLSVPQLVARIKHDQRLASSNATNDSPLPRPTQASYLYAVDVINIVDGDTLDLRIDLGFHTERRGRFRLADVDAPETNTPQGRTARDFLYARLLAAKTIVVKTLRTDLHGRYVAHLFYSHADVPIDQCFAQGVHLNAELITEGHAMLAVM